MSKSPASTPSRSISPTTRALRSVLAAAMLIAALAGCTNADLGSPTQNTLPNFTPTSTTTTSKSAAAEPADYRGLLLTAADLSDADDTFVERTRESQPDGSPGASAFFVNDRDDRAITDTFLVYPDAATATATLKQASGTLPTLVPGGVPKPVAVGTDGVAVSGTYPDDAKAVTLMFFTEGRALVRLEFQSATGDATTDGFVLNVGKMQQIALRTGLADAE